METLTDVRKELKALGYGVKTKSVSWGRAATYTKDGVNMPSIFTHETLPIWKPLIDWRKDNREQLKIVRNNEDCTGLI